MNQNPKDPNNPSGPIVVNDLIIKIDRDLCIGAATCLAIAPEVFALDSDAKAIVLNTADATGTDMILDAARGCPTAAIIVETKDGQKLFPK